MEACPGGGHRREKLWTGRPHSEAPSNLGRQFYEEKIPRRDNGDVNEEGAPQQVWMRGGAQFDSAFGTPSQAVCPVCTADTRGIQLQPRLWKISPPRRELSRRDEAQGTDDETVVRGECASAGRQ
mmetsp:Transcript_51557/g.154767  ORF Transcript_51557/g.154767 Transcript_51557/m.154767 type:complete len:125 (-) Transcript_51557:49-423(-)